MRQVISLVFNMTYIDMNNLNKLINNGAIKSKYIMSERAGMYKADYVFICDTVTYYSSINEINVAKITKTIATKLFKNGNAKVIDAGIINKVRKFIVNSNNTSICILSFAVDLRKKYVGYDKEDWIRIPY